MLKDTSIKDLRGGRGCKSLIACVFALFKNNKPAFTLAETLIVIGIIGVVAALTIPNLTQSTGDKEKVAKVKKIQSNMEDAFGRATATYGPVNDWYMTDADDNARKRRTADRLLDFLKVTKNCQIGNSTCFSGLENVSSNSLRLVLQSAYKFVVADGTAFAMLHGDPDNTYLLFDIDGPTKGKNIFCSDVFSFRYEKAQLTFPGGGSTGDFNFTPGVNSPDECTEWIIRNDNLEYLKLNSGGQCPDGKPLNWDTKTTCK